MQQAVRTNSPQLYAEFAKAVNEQAEKLCTLRGLFEFEPGKPVPIEEVEPASEIVKRFCTGAMSHGSISKEAHECLAIAMNRIGAMSNTGEGGEDPARYTPEPNGDSKNCGIKQVASGRFGVTINYLAHAKELQIKIAQGAKPGEGGQLPGHKVTEEIARLRYSTPGVTLISPPPHHDIYSIEDLAQLIYDLKCSNPGVRVSVKLVAEVGVGTIAAGVAKANADEVLNQRARRRNRRKPAFFHKTYGNPVGTWPGGDTAGACNERSAGPNQGAGGRANENRARYCHRRIAGAERFGFGTAALVTLGCTLLRKCHEGACPFGIATQDPELRKRFGGKPEYLERYMFFVAEEVRQIMAQLGFRKFEDMIGRVERLRTNKAIEHWKSKGLDFSAIFHKPDASGQQQFERQVKQPEKLADHLDWQIIEKAKPAIENKKHTVIEMQYPQSQPDRRGDIEQPYTVSNTAPKDWTIIHLRCILTVRRGKASARSCRRG